MKTYKKLQRAKAKLSFARRSATAGFHAKCKECVNAEAKLRRKKNAKRLRELDRERYDANRFANNVARSRARAGFVGDTFEKTLTLQRGRCAICGVPLPPSTRGKTGLKTHCDHDHKTGRPRGLLCSSCNRGLGQFRDSIENLIAAAWYLVNPPLGGA